MASSFTHGASPSGTHSDASLFSFTSTTNAAGVLHLLERPRLFTLAKQERSDYLCDYILPLSLTEEEARLFFQARASSSLSVEEDRAVGALMGMAVGDALGGPFEFLPYLPGGTPASTAGLELPPLGETSNPFSLQAGQWTDDTSMGLCLADSLLASLSPAGAFEFSPLDLLLRFTAWWEMGYNNSFRNDAARASTRNGRHSVGLGGIIGASLNNFERMGVAYTQCGDENSSGNGSIMRLAPAPIFFHGDEASAAALSRAQSKTTHRGTEAAECAALLAVLIARAIHAPTPPAGAGGGGGSQAPTSSAAARKDALFFTLSTYTCAAAPSVGFLARGEAEPSGGPDRDWRWRQLPAGAYRFAPTRASKQPGYVGSYCMDALAMALHCVHATGSFGEAVLLAANMRGDADTVAAITGQIAGAVYGFSSIPPAWVEKVEAWDGGAISLKAHCLFSRIPARRS